MQKLLLSYTLLILGITFLIGVCILPGEFNALNQHLDSTITQAASFIAADSAVCEELPKGNFSEDLILKLDRLLSSSENIDYVVIANQDSIRLYHPDHTLIGQTFTGKDEAAILNGSRPYITTRKGNTDVQKRAFHAITDQNGSVIGFIMVSASMATIHRQQHKILAQFLLIFLLILGVGFFFAWMLSRNIRKALLGFEPGTFAKMYLQREEILDKLEEGIMIVNKNGKFLYRNPAALQIFSSDSIQSYAELLPLIAECRQTGCSLLGKLLDICNNSLIASFLPFTAPDQLGSVLIIVRNRTELVQISEQLTGSDHVVDALRANTHEYMNRLHVISGLLQIGATDEALTFISDVSSDIENGYQTIVRQIQNRTIAALILGKYNRAKELDIDFRLRSDSTLELHSPYLSSRELVTLIGNLTENAFEAINKNISGEKHAELFIGSDAHGLTVTMDDTGCGMTEEQIQKIYAGQYTTKGEGHGFGLRLIQEIVHNHNGYLEIESEPGIGTSFTININEKRNGYD